MRKFWHRGSPVFPCLAALAGEPRGQARFRTVSLSHVERCLSVSSVRSTCVPRAPHPGEGGRQGAGGQEKQERSGGRFEMNYRHAVGFLEENPTTPGCGLEITHFFGDKIH